MRKDPEGEVQGLRSPAGANSAGGILTTQPRSAFALQKPVQGWKGFTPSTVRCARTNGAGVHAPRGAPRAGSQPTLIPLKGRNSVWPTRPSRWALWEMSFQRAVGWCTECTAALPWLPTGGAFSPSMRPRDPWTAKRTPGSRRSGAEVRAPLHLQIGDQQSSVRRKVQ